ncbi:MFS transporter [Streptomyces sp. H10-C2]|uniref:MFS transporter n=1 Tax=unclassified Streptomyces TaxID=2593676 RepID=UPI0024BB37C2|nr:MULTISPECIES: MFS transporter [unclassified Streptomyces]MDJ0342441.1 MFS transporter [Streptomyces sp. PH10-H1]MDJ0372296.1 MFS transporter [Streptomyces sp. H10-C2]
MGPLALVFLVRERPGGYGLGAALAAAFVIGEVIAAPWLGTVMRPARARTPLAAGLVAGGTGFAGLAALPNAHPAVLAALAVLAGGGPAAVPGGLRMLLMHLVPEQAAARALSGESMLTFGIAAASPALASGLVLGVAPALPLALSAVLAALAAVGLFALPAGWRADPADREGVSMTRTLAAAWPVYVTGAAGLSLLALTELVLPALLEQRGIAVGWSGPLLAGYSVAAAVGAFVYGTRGWPGRLGTQSLVLLLGLSACVTLTAAIPALGAIAVALLIAGLLEAGVHLARNLSLREVLPPSAQGAGYSVLYAAIGVGYTSSAVLAGAVQSVASPSAAILCGVVLTLVLTAVSAVGGARAARRPARREIVRREIVRRESARRESARRESARRESAGRESARRETARRETVLTGPETPDGAGAVVESGGSGDGCGVKGAAVGGR